MAVVAALVIAALALLLSQPRIERHGGQGNDGVEYHAVAEAFRGGHPVRAEAPFAFRIGTPFLAAVVGDTLDISTNDAFGVVNLLAGVAFFALLYRYLRQTGSCPPWSLALVAVAVASWVMPFRFVAYYPVQAEPVALALVVLGLLLLERAHLRGLTWAEAIALAAIVSIGVLFREQVLVVGLAAAAQSAWRDRATVSSWLRALLPLGAGAAVALATHVVVEPTGGYSYASEVVDWLGRHTVDDLVLASFLAFGIVTVLALVFADGVLRWLVAEPYRIVVAGAVPVLAWIGGSDTERLLVAASPLLFAAVGRALTRYDWRGLGRPRRWAAAGLGIAVVLFSQGLFLPMRADAPPFDLDASTLLHTYHAIPLLSVLNAPTFEANNVSLTAVLYKRALLAEWLVVTVAAVLVLRPGAWLHLRRWLRQPPPVDPRPATTLAGGRGDGPGGDGS